MTLNTHSLSQIESSLAQRKSRYDKAQGQFDLLITDRKDKATQLTFSQNDIAIYEQVQALFGKVSEFARVQFKARIEDTVSAGLQAVFEDDSEFRVHMRTVGGVPAADWQSVSYKNGVRVISDVEDGDGGGACDLDSLALRMAFLESSRPRPEGPLILDEPGKMIDKIAIPNMAQFVKAYIARVGRQGILITHHDALEEVADVAYRVAKGDDGLSEVVRV